MTRHSFPLKHEINYRHTKKPKPVNNFRRLNYYHCTSYFKFFLNIIFYHTIISRIHLTQLIHYILTPCHIHQTTYQLITIVTHHVSQTTTRSRSTTLVTFIFYKVSNHHCNRLTIAFPSHIHATLLLYIHILFIYHHSCFSFKFKY